MAHAKIGGKEFSLFYDYDQLRDKKLSQLSNNGKIKWFQLRTSAIFLEPLKRIFNRSSTAHQELNSVSQHDQPFRTFTIAAFSILLNGVEALGSFLATNPKPKNWDNFYAFIRNYMKDWDTKVLGTSYRKDHLPWILWKHFRNGIAHSFVIEGGGIDYDADVSKWRVKNGRLEIGPTAFFKDFLVGVKAFFADVKSKKRLSFLSRFKKVYPC